MTGRMKCQRCGAEREPHQLTTETRGCSKPEMICKHGCREQEIQQQQRREIARMEAAQKAERVNDMSDRESFARRADEDREIRMDGDRDELWG